MFLQCIHKSHSRRDLLEIIKLFKLPIEDAEDFKKKELGDALILSLNKIDNIIPDELYYNISNLNELKEFLIKPNQKKMLSIKDKSEVMTSAKLIIAFCKGGYVLQISYYDTIDQLYTEARRISQFGDIPSVRRCCELLNKNPYSKERVYPVISKKIQKDLDVKKLTQKKVHTSLHVKKGKVLVKFD
jgi:hypothetical protein